MINGRLQSKHIFRITLLVLFMIAGSFRAFLTAHPTDDYEAAVIEGKKLLEEGVSKFDEATLISARSHFERLLSHEQMSWLTEYYLAYADYRLAIYYQTRQDTEQLIKYLDDGLERIKTSLSRNETFADAYGLQSALLGQKIGTDPSLGMSLGMQTMTAMGNAKTYGENNPRVALFSAISAYYTPEQFGGSKERAAEEIARAVELFESESLEDKRLPSWGHSEALAWQAKFYLEAGQADLARASIESALKINPEYGFAGTIQRQLQTQSHSFAHLKEPRISTKKDQKVIVVEARGDPKVVGGKAFGLLFQTYYSIPETPKGPQQPAPRARWPQPFETPRSEWIGLYAMPVPDTIENLPKRDPQSGLTLSLGTWEYGQVAEILHVGPYDKEQPTIKKLKDFVEKQGYEIAGPHEEEYIKGPTMTSPGNPDEYLTILRYRVKKSDKS